MSTPDTQLEFIRLSAMGFAQLQPDPFLAAPEDNEDDDEEDEDEEDDEDSEEDDEDEDDEE